MVEAMPSAESHERTFTERARRQQLIGVTIEQVAQRGIAGASLAHIAEATGITKTAVLYHFGSKDALVTAASGSFMADRPSSRARTGMSRGSSWSSGLRVGVNHPGFNGGIAGPEG